MRGTNCMVMDGKSIFGGDHIGGYIYICRNIMLCIWNFIYKPMLPQYENDIYHTKTNTAKQLSGKSIVIIAYIKKE